MKQFNVEELEKICLAVLMKAGVPHYNAKICADVLIKAELRGLDFLGLKQLSTILNGIRSGFIKTDPPIRILTETKSIAVMDGGYGLGQVLGTKAMKLAIAKAQERGIGAVSLRHTNDFGMAAYYSMQALKNDFIGIAMCNGSPFVAPWGGCQPVLGTNPLSVAIPTGKAPPIVLDMATSTVAHGKISTAAARGENLPEGWAIDKFGNPTVDPSAALEGALTPLGGPKGYGLSIVVDVISGALSGECCSPDVRAIQNTSGDTPPNRGQFYLALNVDQFIPIDQFKARIDKLVSDIKTSRKRPGVDRILLPGECEFEEEKKRLKEGIPLTARTLDILESISLELSLDLSFVLDASE